MLIVGTGETARKVARQILEQHDFAYRARRLHRRRRRRGSASGSSIRRSSARRRTSTGIVADTHVDRIVVGLSDRRGRLPIEELLRAKMAGVRVEDATTTYERLTGKILIDDLQAELADLLGRLPRLARRRGSIKRMHRPARSRSILAIALARR